MGCTGSYASLGALIGEDIATGEIVLESVPKGRALGDQLLQLFTSERRQNLQPCVVNLGKLASLSRHESALWKHNYLTSEQSSVNRLVPPEVGP